MTSEIAIATERDFGMPWQARDFKKKNKKLNPRQLKIAAAAANAALKSGKSEGAAIRIGNAAGNKAKRKRA